MKQIFIIESLDGISSGELLSWLKELEKDDCWKVTQMEFKEVE